MPSHPHCHWRDAQEWKRLGLEMSTPSDEACKMFDACLTQIVNLFDDPAIGGTGKCAEKMLEADPEFVLGHALANRISGKRVRTDPELAQKIYKMVSLSERPSVKPWERSHALAVKYYVEGYTKKAADIWEDILVEHPHDMFALWALQEAYTLNGWSQGLRDSCGRVLPYWKPSTPLYGNLLGMYAFGLEETNTYDAAERTAMKALDINRRDTWAIHCVAHINEMTGKFKEGSEFMEKTESDWNDSTLQGHNYWHWALFHYEALDHEAALGIVDNYILPYLKKHGTIDSLTDASTALFRLETLDLDMSSRWTDCYTVASNHVDKRLNPYRDMSLMLSAMGVHEHTARDRLVEIVRDHCRSEADDISEAYGEFGLPMLESLQCYDNENYSRAVELMMPLKYQGWRVGGSHAQRDVINIFTISAAMKSKNPHHKKYASHLLNERKMLKGETPLIESLLRKLDANQ